MKRTIDMTGQRFGTWVVLEHAGFSSGMARIAKWKCRCDCGNEGEVYGTALRSGKSLGCTKCAAKKISKSRTKHGDTGSPTWISWRSMKNRCNCRTSPDYDLYGGRGIFVCERWNEFENFLEDMGERPPGTSLDRIDSDDGYYQENCRWSTPMEQANNRRNNRIVSFGGEDLTIAEFARSINADRKMVRYWLVEKGLSPFEIIDNVITVTKSGGLATATGAIERGF